jgi:hypothetical protein
MVPSREPSKPRMSACTRVLHRGDKTYTIAVQGASKIVSIDCVKPEYILHVDTDSTSPLANPSSITTCSG